jgi:hypothetical protein
LHDSSGRCCIGKARRLCEHPSAKRRSEAEREKRRVAEGAEEEGEGFMRRNNGYTPKRATKCFSEWQGEKLVWCIEGHWISDADLKTWCYLNMDYPGITSM